MASSKGGGPPPAGLPHPLRVLNPLASSSGCAERSGNGLAGPSPNATEGGPCLTCRLAFAHPRLHYS